MEKLIRKITNIAVIALAGSAGLFGLYVMFTGSALEVGKPTPIGLDAAFYLTYLMIFIGVALILVFGGLQIASSKKQIIRTLIVVVIAVSVFLVCYLIAPTELSVVAERVGITESAYRWVGASLNLAYVMFAGLILTFLGMNVYMKIKNR